MFQPRRLAIYAVYFALVPLYLLIRGRVLGFALGYEIVKPLHWYGGGQADGSRLVTVFKIFFYYLKTTFYPVYLCFECKMAASPSWTDPFALAAIVITLFVLFAAAVAFFKAPLLSLGALWFYLALLPVSNIFPIQDLAMEHFLYLPSAGFCLVLALGFQKAAEALAKKPGRERPLVFGLLALILCSYAVTTWRRSQVYRSDQALWLDTVNKAPLSYRAQYNLAKLFYDQGDKIGAVRRLRLAAMADPSDPYAPHNLGVTLKAMGRLEEAIGGYREAARLKPEDWSFRMDLASALEQAGDREGAVNEYRAALKIEPQSLAAADGLGRVYALLGRCEDAQRIYASTGSKSSPAFIRSLDERCSGNAPAE